MCRSQMSTGSSEYTAPMRQLDGRITHSEEIYEKHPVNNIQSAGQLQVEVSGPFSAAGALCVQGVTNNQSNELQAPKPASLPPKQP